LQVKFEHNYQLKYMTQSFAEPVHLSSPTDVQQWRSQWMAALSSWHSPYKALIDCSNLESNDTPEINKAIELMIKFFTGFFLRKAVGFSPNAANLKHLPFEIFESLEDASIALGIRTPKAATPGDFRSSIQFQNHFQQHVVELNFAEPVVISTSDQVVVLKSKIMNTLMQWHSKWSLMIDCTNLEVDPIVHPDLERMFKVLNGLFMKTVIGYSPKGAKETYPFPVYRARHKAAAQLEHEGSFSGDAADCKSKKA